MISRFAVDKKSIRGGFSLVELLAVIAIIGLLANMTMSSFLLLQIKAARAEMHLYLRTITSLMHAYHGEHGAYYNAFTGPAETSPELFWSYGPVKTGDRCTSTPLGFSSKNCESMRYFYSVTNHGQNTFVLRAEAMEIRTATTLVQRNGNPPINPRRCQVPSPVFTAHYADIWSIDQENVLTPNMDATETCL